MLTSKQRAYLRSLAHHLEPAIHVGKNGITEGLATQTNQHLAAHELVKCTLQKSLNKEVEVKAVAEELAAKTDSEIVQVIGRKFVLFKRNPEEPVINLPR